jgi:hypothetical protein
MKGKIIMTMNDQKNYKTSDLCLATAISLYFSLQGLERVSSGKAYFNFEHTDELDRLLEQYWKRELLVEPQQFFQQQKLIKSRLYNE